MVKDKCHLVAKVFVILAAQAQLAQSILRSEGNVLYASAFIVIRDFLDQPKFAADRAAIQLLHRDVLGIDVIVERLAEDFFFGAKFLNDLLRGQALRLGRIERACSLVTIRLRHQRRRDE